MGPSSDRWILGLHSGHNASACIGDEAGIRFAIQEERLTGEKNYWGYPERAVQACLDAVGATARDVGTVAHGSTTVSCDYHDRDAVIRGYSRQGSVQGKLRQRVLVPAVLKLRPTYNNGKLERHLRQSGLAHAALTYHDHHVAHAGAAYFGLRTSPDKPYLVLTCDGVGDEACATVAVHRDGGRRELARVDWANSLGAIYSWVTYGYGFVPLEHEYKLMGMAPYAPPGAAEEIAAIFKSYLWLDDTGLGFQRGHTARINDSWARIERELRGKRFDHVFAGLQHFTEELLTAWTERAVEATGIRDVLAAGGVFMNVKANQRIAALDCIDSFQAFPSCGDETLAMGALYLEAAGRGRAQADAVVGLSHYYLGDAPDEAEAERVLRATAGIKFDRPDDIAGAVADLLVGGEAVARAAGNMEFGARALGNRSILADPQNVDIVRVINQMVKKRDFWMPFAPMVLADRQDDYLHNPKRLSSPYMMMTFDTRENFRELLAAVHNADLTCRPQLLEEHQNPDMHAILKAFEARTGRGVVLNTSFNLHGYPIVRTATEAVEVLLGSGLRHLQVGPFLASKVD